jgi:predicted anti-sigma-YlaC factor YlaD
MTKFLAAVRLILTLKCEHSTQIVSESLDRDLSRVERWAVRLHYIGCYSCRRFGRQIRQLRDSLRQHPARTTEAQRLSPAAMQRIEDAIRKQL